MRPFRATLVALATSSAAAVLGGTASAGNCRPTISLIGTPCIGQQVTLVMSGHLDCKGCLVGSTDPGPTQIGAHAVPVGSPAEAFVIGFAGDVRTFVIPNDPTLVGQTFHFASVLTDGTTMDVSPPMQATICQ